MRSAAFTVCANFDHMKTALVLLLLFSNRLSFPQDYKEIQKRLEEVNALDQKYRVIIDSLVRKRKLEWKDPEIQKWIPIAARQDSVNLITVLRLIDQYGWLGISKIGVKANETQFLIVQHADSNVMIKYFPLLVKSYETGESPGKFYAMMLDRILVEKGQKQVYGTQIQMRNEKGEFLLFPIENEAWADKRRRKVGLTTLKAFRAGLTK